MDRELADIDALFHKKLINAIKEKLPICNVDLNVLAEGLLKGSSQLLPNAYNRGNNETIQKTIANAQTLETDTFDRACLFLLAPTSISQTFGDTTGGQVQLSREHDSSMRDLEAKQFAKVYPGLNDNPSRNPHQTITVDNYEDIQKALRCFFSTIGRKAKIVLIVFHGHGQQTGELLVQRENAEDPDSITTETFVQEIRELVEEAQSQHSMDDLELPLKVNVIFPQCYGYKYCRDPGIPSFINVTPLTDEKNESTYTEISIKPDGTQIVQAKNIHLNKYATKLAELQKQLDGTTLIELERANEGGGQAAGANAERKDVAEGSSPKSCSRSISTLPATTMRRIASIISVVVGPKDIEWISNHLGYMTSGIDTDVQDKDKIANMLDWAKEKDIAVLNEIFIHMKIQPGLYKFLENIEKREREENMQGQVTAPRRPEVAANVEECDPNSRLLKAIGEKARRIPGLRILVTHCYASKLEIFVEIEGNRRECTSRLKNAVAALGYEGTVEVRNERPPSITRYGVRSVFHAGGKISTCTDFPLTGTVGGYLQDGEKIYAITAGHLFKSEYTDCLLHDSRAESTILCECYARITNAWNDEYPFPKERPHDIAFVRPLDKCEQHFNNLFLNLDVSRRIVLFHKGHGLPHFSQPLVVCRDSSDRYSAPVTYISYNPAGQVNYFTIQYQYLKSGDSGTLVAIEQPDATLEACGIIIGKDSHNSTIVLPLWSQIQDLCNHKTTLFGRENELKFM